MLIEAKAERRRAQTRERQRRHREKVGAGGGSKITCFVGPRSSQVIAAIKVELQMPTRVLIERLLLHPNMRKHLAESVEEMLPE